MATGHIIVWGVALMLPCLCFTYQKCLQDTLRRGSAKIKVLTACYREYDAPTCTIFRVWMHTRALNLPHFDKVVCDICHLRRLNGNGREYDSRGRWVFHVPKCRSIGVKFPKTITVQNGGNKGCIGKCTISVPPRKNVFTSIYLFQVSERFQIST